MDALYLWLLWNPGCVMDWWAYLDAAKDEPHWPLIALDMFFKTTPVELAATAESRKAFIDELVARYCASAECSEHVVRGLIGIAFQLAPHDRRLRANVASRVLDVAPTTRPIVQGEFAKLGERVPASRPAKPIQSGDGLGAARRQQPPRKPRRGQLRADAAIFVPLTIELAAVEAATSNLELWQPGRRDEPTIFRIQCETGEQPLELALVQGSEKGQDAARFATASLAKRVSAKAFLLIGVAGGLGGGLRKLDVAFSTTGFDDRLGRETSKGHETEARPLGEVARAARLAFDDWSSTLPTDAAAACRVAVDPGNGSTFRVRATATSSGNVVLDAGAESTYRGSIAGPGRNLTKIIEMEFAGMLDGLREAYPRKLLPVAMFRGISDTAQRKAKESQYEAARRATYCAVGFLPFLLRRESN